LGHALAAPGLSLEALFEVTRGVATRDEIYSLIATGALSVEIRNAPVRQPDRVAVFAPGEKQLERAAAGRPAASLHAPQALRQTTDPEVLKMVSNADEQDLRIANLRCRVVHGLQNGGCDADTSVPPRTLRRWAASYRAAETKYGNGYIGLLPRTQDRGNSTQRLPENTRLLMNDFISSDYETLKQKSMYISWTGLKRACEARNTQTPSYKTFSHAVRAKAGFQQTLKRQGRRAARIHQERNRTCSGM
jgi:hypothetical protein